MMNKKGFTLTELLVVICIVATLLTLAVINGRAWINRYNVETMIKRMETDLLTAKASAMQRNRIYFVVITPTQYTIYEDTDSPPNGNGQLNPALDRRVSQTTIDPRYALTIPANGGEIDFDTRGFTTTVPGPMGTQANYYVTTSYNASLDCIAVSTTKINLGVWNAGGATCVAQ